MMSPTMSALSLRRPSVASQTQISMALMLYETQLEDHSSEETSWRITVQKKPSWRTTIRMKPKSRGDAYSIGAITIIKAYYKLSLSFILSLVIVLTTQVIGITAQQIGSGYSGLGVGVFTFDWAGISAYHGSPLVTPWTSILNDGFGFVIFIYIIMPLCYWKFNTFDAQKFPIFSSKFFTFTGHKYDTTKILTPQFDINIDAYNSYGKLSLSQLFALSIGSGFARFTATLVHVALFHGSDILKQSKSAMQYAKMECGLERESIP
ncbi:hypothetical protein EV1_012408 [Malus domestica]